MMEFVSYGRPQARPVRSQPRPAPRARASDEAGGRVAWADTAKGICIILVVMMHATLGVGAEGEHVDEVEQLVPVGDVHLAGHRVEADEVGMQRHPTSPCASSQPTTRSATSATFSGWSFR